MWSFMGAGKNEGDSLRSLGRQEAIGVPCSAFTSVPGGENLNFVDLGSFHHKDLEHFPARSMSCILLHFCMRIVRLQCKET